MGFFGGVTLPAVLGPRWGRTKSLCPLTQRPSFPVWGGGRFSFSSAFLPPKCPAGSRARLRLPSGTLAPRGNRPSPKKQKTNRNPKTRFFPPVNDNGSGYFLNTFFSHQLPLLLLTALVTVNRTYLPSRFPGKKNFSRY